MKIPSDPNDVQKKFLGRQAGERGGGFLEITESPQKTATTIMPIIPKLRSSFRVGRFVLEVVLDNSFEEKVDGRWKYRYKTESNFIVFKSKPTRLERNAYRHLAKFLKSRRPYRPIITIRLYKQISSRPIESLSGKKITAAKWLPFFYIQKFLRAAKPLFKIPP